VARLEPDIAVSVENLRETVRAIRQADAEIAKELRRTFRHEIGKPILAQVRAVGPTIIPRRKVAGRGLVPMKATVWKLDVDNDRIGIRVTNAGPGEHGQLARIFEIGSARNRGYIRHPLWPRANTPRSDWKWSGRNQPIKPVVKPIIQKNREQVLRQVFNAVTDAARRANLEVKVRG
jgi:hypothetical protein